MSEAPQENGQSRSVIAVSLQKGGVGKTTTAINLGAALAELGFRTLIVDLDPDDDVFHDVDRRTLPTWARVVAVLVAAALVAPFLAIAVGLLT